MNQGSSTRFLSKTGWRLAVRIALTYLVFSVLWILFSDHLLAWFVQDIQLYTRIQTGKGLFFVICSALLIFFISLREVRARQNQWQIKQQSALKIKEMQKNQELAMMAHGVAHDFNNILNGVSGYAELALDPTSNDTEIRSYLEQIVTNSNRAQDLTRRILDFGRSVRQNPEPIVLCEPLQEAVNLTKTRVGKNIALNCHCPDERVRKIQIMGHSTSIHQIAVNLCWNAVQAIGDQQGTIDLSLQQASDNNHLLLFIRDNGPGMTPEISSQIWQPYFTGRSKSGGTGLGLSIVKTLVQEMNGTIELETAPGRGCEFTLQFPILKA